MRLKDLLRPRSLTIGCLLIVLALSLGAFIAWRVSRFQPTGTGPGWEPPATAVTPATSERSDDVLATITAILAEATAAKRTPQATTTPTELPSTSPTAAVDEATPEPSPSPAGGFRYLPAGPVVHTTDGCPGQYIIGYVKDSSGTLLSGVTLRSTDQWGNDALATTKSGPGDVGRYDFPLFPPQGMAMTYRIVVLDEAGQPVSPELTVEHRHEGEFATADCHWLDWERSD